MKVRHEHGSWQIVSLDQNGKLQRKAFIQTNPQQLQEAHRYLTVVSVLLSYLKRVSDGVV